MSSNSDIENGEVSSSKMMNNSEIIEVDLGSAASSANSSGDEQEGEEEAEDENEENENSDPEIEFKTSPKKSSPSKRSTRSSGRRNDPSPKKKSSRTTSSRSEKQPLKKRKSGPGRGHDHDHNSRSSRSKSRKSTSPLPNSSSRKSSNSKSSSRRSKSSKKACQICEAKVDDLPRHLSLDHFKSNLIKLLPSQPPFKCPKCNVCETSQKDLICHYGGKHKLNDRYLEEEMSKIKDKSLNGVLSGSNGNSRRSGRNSTPPKRSGSVDSDVIVIDDSSEPVTPTPKSPETPQNGQKQEESSAESESDDNADVTKPPNGYSTPRASSLAGFVVQLKEFLGTKDGRFAKPASNSDNGTAVLCICGKILRGNSKYNWKFMVQKPLIKDGKVINRGHWYNCKEVQGAGIKIGPWKISKAEIRESRNLCNVKKAEENESNDESNKEETLPVKRRSRKRVIQDSVSSDLIHEHLSAVEKKKKVKEVDENGDKVKKDDSKGSNEEESDEEDYEETQREMRWIIHKKVKKLLASREVGRTFLQDGPCFLVSLIIK